VIHFTADVDKPKVVSAREKIVQLNPDVNVVAYHELLNSENITEIIKDYDFVVDGTDNFPVKFLINDACVLGDKPFSHGGILRFEGQTMTYTPGNACYRCVFRNPPPPGSVPTCSQAGVLGSVAGILGTIQATEVLKFLTGTGELLTNRLLIFQALNMDFRTAKFKRNDDCPVCGSHRTITDLVDYEQTVCSIREKD
jgi:molybdopterin/thiamine biosynthesis adenylyltransferase